MKQSSIETIVKRDGSKQAFDLQKIIVAIEKALDATQTGTHADAKNVATVVHTKIEEQLLSGEHDPTVEHVQDLVELSLMELGFLSAAKAYILYRDQQARERERDIFKPRTNLKPYEYPELIEYVDAIRHSYWIHTEFNFTGDIDDFKVKVTDAERDAIKKTMLAIAQIEVDVKTFWSHIYDKMPKPEIGAVGATFAESEVRHTDAYSHLLEILGLNQEFKTLAKEPVIQQRIGYLEKTIALSKTNDDREYAQAVLLFSLFIEHVSLFSQFLIMMSFNKHRNLFKGVSNAVEATSKEEQIHGMFGTDIINFIKEEHPEWFDAEHKKLIQEMCQESYEAESAIVDWIFEKGEFDFMPKAEVKEFIKNRLNNSLNGIGVEPIFAIDEALVEKTDWFDDEVVGTKHVDFFDKRSINYNKRQQSVTSDDLF